ncbi:MAG: UbiA family prenyltransferase, partial [Chloroflexota bacterium]
LIFVVPGLLLSSLSFTEWLKLLQAFICFGMMASGTYLLNDLCDIPDDRKHATKKNRPLAAGNLSVPVAATLMAVLVFSSVLWASLLQYDFAVILILYALTTAAYSFRLKRLPIVDVFILAALFSLRVLAGAALIGAPPTAWLMGFIGLTFLSLALAKRYVEVTKRDGEKKIPGRGYLADDGPMLMAFGAASAYTAVLALGIYGLLAPDRLIDSEAVMITLATVVAAWFFRIWLLAGRRELDDDPVLFAVKDKVSLLCLALAGGIVVVEETQPIWNAWF